MSQNEIVEKSVEPEIKKENKEKAYYEQRSDILKKAREAKKRKKEHKETELDSYNLQLEGIHNHLKALHSQMNTLVSVVGETKNEKIAAKVIEVPKEILKDIEQDKTEETEESFFPRKFSFYLGEAVTLALAGGGLYYFKRRKSHPDHLDKYSGLH